LLKHWSLFLDNSGIAYGAGNDSTITLNSSNPIAINVGNGSSLQNKKILSVKCGFGSGYAMDTAQNIHTWGSNSSGQLGRNSTTGSLVPMDIEKTLSSLSGKVAIGFNPSISNLFMLTNDGGIHATGAGSFGRLGDGQNTINSLMAKNITFYGKPTTDASAVTVTNIGSNSATINWTNGNGQKRLVVVKPLSPIDGNIINDGVNYADTADFTKGKTLDGFSKVVYSGTANSVTVTGLDQSSQYHVAIFEFDSAVVPCNLSYYKLGTPAKGNFTTTGPLTLAAVNTSSASLVNSTSATLGGNITADGGAAVTERGIVYATTINPTTANSKVQIGSGIGTFSQNVTGLSATTLYHVRAYAINSVGTSYGADSTFTTLAGNTTPVVITGNAINIANSSATLNGNVVNDGGANVTERGVVFATSVNPTTTNSKVQMGTGTGTYSQTVTALLPNTLYYFRAYATNSVGTAYGIDSTFKTLEATVLYNAFSPDGDGINDNWVIENAADLNEHEIVVFNIFGQEVFHQTGYTNAWDGKIDGNPVPSGEYYYLIKGSKINTKGALLIKNKQ
jgi:gliding motility-associated-like protein